MKLITFRTTLLGLLSVHGLAQADSLQVYGRLNSGVEHMRAHGAGQDDIRASRLSNYRSVFGIQGSEALGPELRVVFQVEGTLALDTGAGAFAARDTRLGLEGRWGTLFAGNWSTPYNTATSSLDPFYPTTAGYMSIMGNGSAASADNLSDTSSFDRRQRNSVHYWSPAWRGLKLRLAHGMSEERPASGARPALDSGALIFEQGTFYAALAHERHHAYRGPGLDDHATKLGVAYRYGEFRAAAAVEKLHYRTTGGTLERTAWFLALTRQHGAHGWRLALARAGDGKGRTTERVGFVRAGRDTGALHATVGYDHSLSKRTSLFAFHTRLRNDARGTYDFAINELGLEAGASARGTAVGLRHAF
jgi:predicted porin